MAIVRETEGEGSGEHISSSGQSVKGNKLRWQVRETDTAKGALNVEILGLIKPKFAASIPIIRVTSVERTADVVRVDHPTGRLIVKTDSAVRLAEALNREIERRSEVPEATA